MPGSPASSRGSRFGSRCRRKIMRIPGFSAEASLVERSSSRGYGRKAPGGQRGKLQRTVVVPQLPKERGVDVDGFQGKAGCLIDCADAHPHWTDAQCAAICRDPGGTHGSGSAQVRDFPSRVPCYAGYAYCRESGMDSILAFSCLPWIGWSDGPCSCDEVYSDCMSG